MIPDAPAARPPESIYLDHAAAAPLLPEVAAAMDAVRETGFANPSSPHGAGRQARRLLEDARERILAVVGGDLGPGARLVFTSGATEANRLGILGMATAPTGRVLSSARDHTGVRAAGGALAERGWTALDVPLRPSGTLDLGGAGAAPHSGTTIACVTLVCGQSGILEDVAAVAAWAAADTGRLVHVDATQAFTCTLAESAFGLPGHVAATAAFAPHKFGGPRGIGGLVVRHDVAIAPLAPGPQEAGLRGGTEPVALAVGFARAVEVARAGRAAVARRVAALRDRLETGLVAAAAGAGIPALVVVGDAPRAPHVATVAFVGVDRQAFVMAADLEGVCCASGTACASGSSEPAPALVAMGLPAAVVAGAVRFSLGPATTEADVDAAVARLDRVVSRLRPRG